MTATAATGARVDPDRDLVERARAGEEGRFDQLVRQYQRPIYYLVMRYVRNEADAMDVSQRTFVRAFRSLERFRGASTFRTWLYRIAINLSLNHLRDHRREHASEIPEDAMATDAIGASDVIRGEDARRLRAAIAELPPKQRAVLELRVFDELSFREVAELADCTENAAKVNFHHAVKRLRFILEPDTAAGGDRP